MFPVTSIWHTADRDPENFDTLCCMALTEKGEVIYNAIFENGEWLFCDVGGMHHVSDLFSEVVAWTSLEDLQSTVKNSFDLFSKTSVMFSDANVIELARQNSLKCAYKYLYLMEALRSEGLRKDDSSLVQDAAVLEAVNDIEEGKEYFLPSAVCSRVMSFCREIENDRGENGRGKVD